jgi:D-threo-aldose 1-dehydrogenase
MPSVYGYAVDSARAIATVGRALQLGFIFIDTSNEYGDGESERRIGAALHEAFPRSEDVVLASKADPKRGQKSLDGDRVQESFRESIHRLGVDRLNVYYLHDPERFAFKEMTKRGGAVEAMQRLKREGLVDLIGVAGGEITELRRYLDTGEFDVILNHNHFTLLDRSAEKLITDAVAAEVSFVNAAPYASGMLAKPLDAKPRYRYRAPPPGIVETVGWLHEVCGRFETPLAALALQFSMKNPGIASTVVGVSAPERVDELARNAVVEIPQELWDLVEDRLQYGATNGG